MMTLTVTVMTAQTAEQKKQSIYNIKKSHSYIYAEVTAPEQQDAIDLATDLLHQRVNEYVATQKKYEGAQQIVTVNTQYDVENIIMPRADVYRAFIYVKKKDILPSSNTVVQNIRQETAPLQSKIEDVEKNVDQELEKELEKEAQNVETTDSAEKPVLVLSETERRIMACKTTKEMRQELDKLKAEGKIESFEKFSKLNDLSAYLMVVFDTSGIIKAVLSEGVEKKNVSTGEPDELNNYKGCGAVGVKIKK